jgi:hypothetical protein
MRISKLNHRVIIAAFLTVLLLLRIASVVLGQSSVSRQPRAPGPGSNLHSSNRRTKRAFPHPWRN